MFKRGLISGRGFNLILLSFGILFIIMMATFVVADEIQKEKTVSIVSVASEVDVSNDYILEAWSLTSVRDNLKSWWDRWTSSGKCGDNKIAAKEVCDGTSLNSQTCVNQGFDRGTLSCLGDCTGYDTSGCINDPIAYCGDGIINNNEVCDGNLLGGATCANQGFDKGSLSCNSACSGYDTSGCSNNPIAYCGDNIINNNEVCDGNSLGGKTCATQGFDSGSLSCNSACSGYDTSNCVNDPGQDPSNYVALYKFDGNLNNEKGNYNLVNNGVSFTSGKVGQSGDFSGADSATTSGTDFGLDASDKMTIALWVKADSNSGTLVSRGIVHPFLLSISNGKAKIGMRTSEGVGYATSSADLDSNWHHVTVTHDNSLSSANTKLYVDGDLEDSITLGGVLRTISNGKDFVVGGSFEGQLDDLRIYNSVLTLAEIQTLAGEGTPCTPSCVGRNCGGDSCGGTCGTCSNGWSCNNDGNCIRDCVPSCVPNTCGSNGCGGTCNCNAGYTCNGGTCTPIVVEICGDNIINNNEVCDGGALGGATCISRGFDRGTLSCNSNCLGFDTSSCENDIPQSCGNNLREGTEVCDGSNLGGATCTSQGFDRGTLGCNSNCLSFDTANCVNDIPPVCGDGDCNGGETCSTCLTDCGTCSSREFAYVDGSAVNTEFDSITNECKAEIDKRSYLMVGRSYSESLIRGLNSVPGNVLGVNTNVHDFDTSGMTGFPTSISKGSVMGVRSNLNPKIDTYPNFEFAVARLNGLDVGMIEGTADSSASATENYALLNAYFDTLDRLRVNYPSKDFVYFTYHAGCGTEDDSERRQATEYWADFMLPEYKGEVDIFDYYDVLITHERNSAGQACVKNSNGNYPSGCVCTASDGLPTMCSEYCLNNHPNSGTASLRLGKALYVLFAQMYCEGGTPPQQTCGNSVREGTEVCDGGVGSQTCVSQGFDSGTLSCNSNCFSYDTSDCSNDPGTGNILHVGSGQTYSTISACAAVATPGDTCLVHAGNYNERVRPMTSGNPGEPITFKAAGDGTVTLSSSSSYCFNIDGVNHITIDGFNFGSYGAEACIRINNGDYNKILNSNFADMTSGSYADSIEIQRNSNYNLVEGNTFNSVVHNNIWIQGREAGVYARYNVVRDNTFTNPIHRAMGIHQTEYTLVEDNIFDGTADQFIQLEGPKVILRNNVFANYVYGTTDENKNGAIRLWSPTDEYGNTATARDNRIFHNVFYNNVKTIANYHNDNLKSAVTNNVFKNNIFYRNQKPVDLHYPNPTTTNQNFFFNNILRGTAVGQDVVEIYSGTSTNQGYTVAELQSQFSTLFKSNLDSDPMMDSSYHLQAGSPAIDNGDYLTRAVNSGSNTGTITVEDASYFMDGWGIIGGDQIQIGSGDPVTVTNVNYGANILTLASPRSWSSGAGVSLPYNGAMPDMGAYESAGDVPPECTITDAYWSKTNGVEGEEVTLTVNTVNCLDGQVDLEVWEDDWFGGEDYDFTPVATPITLLDGLASTNWTLEWRCDGEFFGFCVAGDPEYRFTASVGEESKDSGLLHVVPVAYCGDEMKNGNEVCDGNDLDSKTCISQGFDSGSLNCLADCSGYDTSGCVNDPIQICGNNNQEGTEVCDGSDVNGQTCNSQGFDSGTLSCIADCSGYDTSNCANEPQQTCGNNVIEGTEVCDGAAFGGATCTSQGFDSGTLGCNSNCLSFDTSNCVSDPGQSSCTGGNCHYVVQGGTGSRNGNDWSNAWSALPGSLDRGHTYYIADGTYSGYTFDDAVSGSQYITIKKAIASDHGDNAGWQNSYGDGVAEFGPLYFMTSYYKFNGQVGGGPSSWDTGHGFKVVTSGTGGMSHAIFFGVIDSTNTDPRPDYIELRHVDMGGRNWASRTAGRTLNSPGRTEDQGSRYITLSHCYLHDANSLLFTMYTHHWLIEYNYFARSFSEASNHGSGYADRGGDDVTVRYNFFNNVDGTANLDLKKNECNDHERWYVYGNIFATDSGNPYGSAVGGQGVMGVTSKKQCGTSGAQGTYISEDFKFFNNDIVGFRGLNAGLYVPEGTNITAYNNMWYDIERSDGSGALTMNTVDHRYNYYSDVNFRVTDPGSTDTVTSGNPFKNLQSNDFSLNQNTLAGTNICNLYGCNTKDTFNIDMFGNERITWTRGAIEYTG